MMTSRRSKGQDVAVKVPWTIATTLGSRPLKPIPMKYAVKYFVEKKSMKGMKTRSDMRHTRPRPNVQTMRSQERSAPKMFAVVGQRNASGM